MQNKEICTQLLPFANHAPGTVYMNEKGIWSTHSDRKQRKSPQCITVTLEEACLYCRHITSSETTHITSSPRQTAAEPVGLLPRRRKEIDMKPWKPSANTPFTRASEKRSFTSRIKNYCVARLFTYCWSCDCSHNALKDFWLEWASIAEGSFTHTPLIHKHRDRNSLDKNLLTARAPLTWPATDRTHTAHKHER